MDDKGTKFSKFEKIFFRIELAILGVALFLWLLFTILIDYLGPFVDYIMTVIILGFIAVIVTFFISVFRIIIYIVKHRTDHAVSIWRSIANLFLSPLSLIIFYILIFITAVVGCSYGG